MNVFRSAAIKSPHFRAAFRVDSVSRDYGVCLNKSNETPNEQQRREIYKTSPSASDSPPLYIERPPQSPPRAETLPIALRTRGFRAIARILHVNVTIEEFFSL